MTGYYSFTVQFYNNRYLFKILILKFTSFESNFAKMTKLLIVYFEKLFIITNIVFHKYLHSSLKASLKVR